MPCLWLYVILYLYRLEEEVSDVQQGSKDEIIQRLSLALSEAKSELQNYRMKLDTFKQVRLSAQKYAKSKKPNDMSMSDWCRSKEYSILQKGFIAGAKCEHAYLMVERNKNESSNS
jgi:hypothetical protein